MELYCCAFLYVRVACNKKLLENDAEPYQNMFLPLNLECDSISLRECLRVATLERMAHEL